MSKTIKSFIIAFSVIFTAVNVTDINVSMAFADTETLLYEGIKYQINEDNTTVVITGFVLDEDGQIKMDGEDEGTINIPDVIDTKTVTSIADNAFSSLSNLNTIKLPDTIKTIGKNAFSNCVGLTSVALSSDLNEIDDYAFYNCTNLSSIEIPQNVITIGNSAFAECGSLTSINIPKTVTSIGTCAFGGCISLESINVHESNANYSSENGTLYSENKDALYQVSSKNTNFEIPASVKTIGDYAFSGCDEIEAINIPETVNAIGNYAFNGCSSLKEITIPKSITSIGDCPFVNCSKLQKITVNADNANYCSLNGVLYTKDKTSLIEAPAKITNFNMPESVNTIKKCAFKGCSSLTNFIIPENLNTIEDEAFYECSNLSSLIISNDSQTLSIGSKSFSRCYSLKDVVILSPNVTIANDSFEDSADAKLYCSKNDTIKNYYPDIYIELQEYSEDKCPITLSTKEITTEDIIINENSEVPLKIFSNNEIKDLAGNKITQNGTYKLLFTVGTNAFIKDVEITNIDRVNPTINAVASTTDATNKGVDINVTAADDNFAYIEMPDGTKKQEASSKYTVLENGDYTFKAYDKAGNVAQSTVTISNIDKTGPELSYDLDEKNPTNKEVLVMVSSNDSDLDYMIMPDGRNTSKTAAAFIASQNGTYTVKAYDKLGNETIKNIEITNIGHKVDFKDYDGKIINSQIVLNGNAIVVPYIPKKEGYSFKGFDKDINNITADLEVNLLYEINKYKVIVNGVEQTIEYGKDVVLPAQNPTKEGYTFKGWDGQVASIKSDGIVNPIFEINKYKVVVNGVEQTVEYGKDVILPANVVKDGYTFKGWDGQTVSTKSDGIVNPIFEINKYKVVVNGVEQIVEYGKDVVLPAQNPTKEGYTFKGWNGQVASIKGDGIVNAIFEINKYKVLVNGIEQIVEYGKDVVLPAQNPTKEGYTFKGWDGQTALIKSDGIVNPIFEINKYKVLVNGIEQIVEYGKDVVLPAQNPTKEGYTFKGWDGQTVSIRSDGVVNAIFEKNPEEGKPSGENPGTDNPGVGESTKPIMALVFSALSLVGINRYKKKN